MDASLGVVRPNQVAGRMQVDTMSHCAFDDATLQDDDKPMLDDFAKVIQR